MAQWFFTVSFLRGCTGGKFPYGEPYNGLTQSDQATGLSLNLTVSNRNLE